MEGIKICSMNCRGLNDRKKRFDVFHYLRQQNYDIYFLRETDFNDFTESQIRNEWDGEVFVSSKNSMSRGVAVLFKKHLHYQVKNVHKDTNGNLLVLDLVIGGVDILLITLYGPNVDSPDFFDFLADELDESDSLKIVCGDWNLVINPSLDYDNYLHVNNMNARNKVSYIIDSFNSVDIWRHKNKNK